MKLVPNAGRIALHSHSMWAGYLGLLCLVLPEALFFFFERDTDPRLWWISGVVLVAYGLLGRVKDQGIDHTKLRSPAWILFPAVVAALAFVIWQAPRDAALPVAPVAVAQIAPVAPVPVPVPVPVVAASGAVSDAAFLSVAFPLVSKWEGLRLAAYQDIVGVWTVCYGHTKGVEPGDIYSKAQCAALFRAELLEYRAALHRYFTAETIAQRLTPARDAAYSSLAYNVGKEGAGKSTATRRLNAGDVAGGCEALTWWNKAGGRVVRGLARRRADEYQLCMMGLA